MHGKFSPRYSHVKPQNADNLDGDVLTQRVIVPNGLINPTQTTIIEIPPNYQDVPTVVARPKPHSDPPQEQIPLKEAVGIPRNIPIDKIASKLPIKKRTIVETTSYTEEVPVNDDGVDELHHGLAEENQSTLNQNRAPSSPLQDAGLFHNKTLRELSTADCCRKPGPFEVKRNIIPNTQQSGDYSYLDPEKCSVVYDATLQRDHLAKDVPVYRVGKAESPQERLDQTENNSNGTRSVIEEIQQNPAYQTFKFRSTPIPYERKEDPEEELKDVLDNLDLIETARIQRELKQFQKARRKSIYDAANIKP